MRINIPSFFAGIILATTLILTTLAAAAQPEPATLLNLSQERIAQLIVSDPQTNITTTHPITVGVDLNLSLASIDANIRPIEDDIISYYSQGVDQAIQGDHNLAIANYTTALEQINIGTIYNSRGESYLIQERYEEAEKDFKTSIDLYSLDAKPFYNLSLVQIHQDEALYATINLDKAIKLNPEFVKAKQLRAQFHNSSGQQKYDEGNDEYAIFEYKNAIELDPENPLYHYNTGLAYQNLEQYDKAIGAFNTTLKLDPEYPQAEEKREAAIDALTQ